MGGGQMEAMPRHDPIPHRPDAPRDDAALAWSRYRRFMGWMALLALAVALLAVAWLASGDEPLRLHMVVATMLGVGFTMLVGTGLMGLVFLSNRTGHDDAATQGAQDE
jgi:hypothetical protein